MHNFQKDLNKQPYSNNYRPDFAALLSGILFSLAFAPFDYAYAAPLSLAVLFSTWRKISAYRALLRGFLFGLGAFGLGVSWVFVSLHDFGGSNMLVAGLVTLFFVVFWAIFPALSGFLSVRFSSNSYKLLSLPLIWTLIEFFRGHMVLNGFPWLLGAYSQLHTPLSGYINITGAYGASFLLALSAVIISHCYFHRQWRLWLSLFLLGIWATGAYLKTIRWTYAIGNPIQVSLIQGSVSQDRKWLPEHKRATLNFYQQLTEENWDSAIIVWPETAIPAYLSEVYDDFLHPLSFQAKQHGSDLIVSLPVRGQADGEKYNAVITLGKENGMYRKIHLLPFGEYFPWQPISGYILKKLNLPVGSFTPGGERQELLKAGGYRFITSICYEDAFGDAAIKDINNAAFLVNVTNDAWFGNSIEPHQHLQIATMRAIETGRYLLRSTNTGVTAIIDPAGNLIKQAPMFKPAVLTGSITPMGGMTPYSKIGDKPVAYCLFSALALMLVYDIGINRKRHLSAWLDGKSPMNRPL